MPPVDTPSTPCQFCGTPTPMTATKMCDHCWNATQYLPRFLRYAKGRAHVEELLAKHPKHPQHDKHTIETGETGEIDAAVNRLRTISTKAGSIIRACKDAEDHLRDVTPE